MLLVLSFPLCLSTLNSLLDCVVLINNCSVKCLDCVCRLLYVIYSNRLVAVLNLALVLVDFFINDYVVVNLVIVIEHLAHGL